MTTSDVQGGMSLPGQACAFVAGFLRETQGLGRTAALMLLGGVLEGVGLFLLVPLAGLLVAGQGRVQTVAARLFAVIGVETPLMRLAVLLVLFVAVMVTRAGVLLLRDRRLALLSTGFIERQRLALIHALAAARWQDVAGLRHARVTAAIGTDVQKVAAATHYLLQIAVAAVMLGAQWLLTLLIAPALGVLALVFVAIGALWLVPALRRANGMGGAALERQAQMIHASGQFLAGLKFAVAQNAQGAFVRDFEEGAQALTRHSLAFERRQSRMRVTTATVSALAGACVLLVGVWQGVPVASLLVAVVTMARMSGPASQVQQAAQQIAHLLPAYSGIGALIRELAPALSSGLAAATSGGPAPAGAIALDRVAFHHGDGGGVEDVTVRLDPGEIVGVVGASGAGKTTFVDLLAGLIEPAAGALTVGGTALGRAQAARYRARLSYVGQDAFLVHDTIRRNLTLGVETGDVEPGGVEPDGRAAIDDATIWTALDRVGAADLVRGMAAGLDTIVAERGMRLSGGERQRIALARALLRRPMLMILDEATNAIDVAGEHAILTGIAADPARPTVVIVAHRTETLVACDRLLRFAGGRLVEDRAVLPGEAVTHP